MVRDKLMYLLNEATSMKKMIPILYLKLTQDTLSITDDLPLASLAFVGNRFRRICHRQMTILREAKFNLINCFII